MRQNNIIPPVTAAATVKEIQPSRTIRDGRKFCRAIGAKSTNVAKIAIVQEMDVRL